MSDFRITQSKINALLAELRSWDDEETRYTLHELSGRYKLDVFIVQRIALAEGFDLLVGEEAGVPSEVDPKATTQDLDPDELRAAVEQRDPDANYPDVDTGVWRKKPTGEWERIDKDTD